MGILPSEVGYASATTGRGDYKVNKGHVVALGGELKFKIVNIKFFEIVR
jgi:hypothetical protein